MVAYDEGDWENWPQQWGNNLAGIVVKPTPTSTIKSIRTVYTPTTSTDQLTGYTLRIWEGFNTGSGWPTTLIYTQSDTVNWSASQRNFGWVTISVQSAAPVQCDANKTYYIEIEYTGTGFLIPCDGGWWSNSVPSRNSYWRPNLNTACAQFPWGDWNIRAILTQSATDVSQKSNEGSHMFFLSQNYPNPFNPLTTISYSIPKTNFVTLKIYDMLGREIQTLINEVQEPDKYSINFDASKLSSGVYFYKLRVGTIFEKTNKMLFMK